MTPELRMRVAALYDIHGNLPALEAVLEDVRRAKVDAIVVGGDVLPGPMPSETIELLSSLDIPLQCIFGNGDREVLAQLAGIEPTVPERFREVIRWNGEQLSVEQRELIGSWPAKRSFDISGLGEVLFCHATPRNDTEIFTRNTSEERLLPVLEGVSATLLVCGHTHMQFDRMVGPIRVVNAGSVGMPFGEPGAYWLILGSTVELRRTAYDLEAAAARIRSTKYPMAEEFAANNVLRPPAEEEMLAAFAQAELK
jgi:putative phosphoesterase